MQQMLEQSVEDQSCLLEGSILKQSNLLIDMSRDEGYDPAESSAKWAHSEQSKEIKSGTHAVIHLHIQAHTHLPGQGEEGLYSLIFARCEPSSKDIEVSFKLHASFLNPGPNYLSACEKALPELFMIFTVMFLVDSPHATQPIC